MIAPTVTELWERFGCSVIPVKLDKKAAWTLLPQRFDESEQRMRGQWKPFQERKPTADELSRWVKANVPAFAIVTGRISGRITFDFDGEAGVALARQWGIQAHRKTGSGGLHLDVEYPGWFVPTLNSKAKQELGRRWPGLDVKGDGGYCIAIGRNEKGPYEWLRGPEPDPMNVVPAEVWEFLRQYSQPKQQSAAINGKGDHPARYASPDTQRVDPERLIQKALDAAASAGRNNTGFDLACQLRDNGYAEGEVLGIMQNYRSRVASVNTKGQSEVYADTEIRATVREVFSKAAREPWTPKSSTRMRFQPERAPASSHATAAVRRDGSQSADASGEGATRGDEVDLLDYLSNDHGNACRLIALYGADLRYCHPFRKWLVWDGMRWAVDETGRAQSLAKQAMLEFLRQAVGARAEQTEKFARSCLDARRIASMLSMSESDVFVTPAELDTNPYLLNFRNGTVDLRTGELLAHDRADYITKLVHYDYRPEATCPRWQRFLDQIMGGDPDAGEGALDRARRLTEYLQRAFGYSLTGTTIEKAVFVLFGEGDNGKSTMLTTFREIFDEYAVLLQVDTLMVRQQESNNSQADLADLRGARFAQTSETEEGQRLAQGKLKRITQGMGKIKAVRKYQDPISFTESHKLWMDTNRKPAIGDADDKATFSRLHPVPFLVRIPQAQIDKSLPAKLLHEADGIAAWAVEGARRWCASGLNKPPEVDAANEDWRSEMDQTGRFMEECCVTGEAFQVLQSVLYQRYRGWAEAGGEKRVLKSTDFCNKLISRNFERRRRNRGETFFGIGLQAESEDRL